MKQFVKKSKYYDIVYHDKNYKKECIFIRKLFSKFSKNDIKTILDIGCGTGTHAIFLAKKGYEITGIDISNDMLKKAKEKINNSKIKFFRKDMRNFSFNKKFDACICMFDVINYMTNNTDLKKTFMNIGKHLKIGSLLIFDSWNGLAVLRLLPSKRKRMVKKNGLKIVKTVTPKLDAFNHICEVIFKFKVFKNEKLLDEFKETHIVRFLFPQEIKYYLEGCGFKLLKILHFLNLNKKVDENTWKITVVAEKVRNNGHN